MSADEQPSLRSRLFAELARRDIDPKEAAEIMSVPLSSLSRWLTGSANPTVDQVPALAKFLHIEVTVLAPEAVGKLNSRQELDRHISRLEKVADRLEAMLKEERR